MAERWNNPYDDSMGNKAYDLFTHGASVTKVCVKLGIVRDTYYRWKKEHEEFGRAAAAGEEASQIYWEERGEQGIFGEIDKFSASPWIFVMKNRFRESYTDEKKDSTNTSLVELLVNLTSDKNK